MHLIFIFFFFFFNDTATTEIYTLSLHDALPISSLGLAPRVLTPSSFRLAGDHRDARAIDGDIQDRHGGNQRRHFARYDSLSLALAESFDLLTQLHGDSFHLFGPHDHASQCFQVPTTLLEGFFGPYASHHPPHP